MVKDNILDHSKLSHCSSSPLSPKIDAGWRLEMVVKTINSADQKIEVVYFYIVLVLIEIHAGGNQGGMRKL